MDNLPGIVVTGASGRMGRMLAGMIAESQKARLVGCLERPGHVWIGRDIGECLGGANMGVTVSDDPLAVWAEASRKHSTAVTGKRPNLVASGDVPDDRRIVPR